MPFVWKQLGIQTQSVQLWQDAGGGRTRDHPETERDRERQRAGGREQRSEKVASTRDVKNCVCVCMRGAPYWSALMTSLQFIIRHKKVELNGRKLE